MLSFGTNLPGRWGIGYEVLTRTLKELRASGIQIVACSGLFVSLPVGGGRQPSYYNAVLDVRSPFPPASLLRVLKRLERRAGRRLGRHWGPRPLDLDLIVGCGVTQHWPLRRAGVLTLPHPEAHRRAFVLVPLLEINPNWIHPALRVSGRQLLAKLPPSAKRGLVRLPFDE
jgi:2-amino-4-hydroxy-6-hydroxymethyldihydropteridine diphosphokinase